MYLLLTCPNFWEAREDILPLASPGIEFDTAQTPHITFLRRVGLGFTQSLRDGIAEDTPDHADDLDIGRITSLTLDLDI